MAELFSFWYGNSKKFSPLLNLKNLQQNRPFYLSWRLVIAAALTFVIYAMALDGPLFFDDRPALNENQLVKINGQRLDEWRTAAMSSNSGTLRRPIAMATFAANYVVAGNFVPWQIKLVNILVHIGCGVLVYHLCCLLLVAPAIASAHQVRVVEIALIAACIWLLHPLHVSTVLYSVQRMAQLSMLFSLGALVVYLRARLVWAESGAAMGEIVATALWVGFLIVCGTLCKENSVLTLWLICLCEAVCFNGRWSGKCVHPLKRCAWLLLTLPVLALIIAGCYSDWVARGFNSREFSMEQRLLTQSRLLWQYLGWLLLPNPSSMGFFHDDIKLSSSLFHPISTFYSVLCLILLLLVSIFLRPRLPLALLGIGFFLIGHSLESSIFALEMVYEHRNYLPSVGICLVVAYLLGLIFERHLQSITRVVHSGIFLVLALFLFLRTQTWTDDLLLTKTEVINHPGSPRANFFLANSLLERYLDAERYGYTASEAERSLVASRHYFERMYIEAPRDSASLVMLHYLDSAYFPELRERVDWLTKLEVLLEEKTMQASDFSAVGSLVDCFSKEVCQEGRGRILAILDRLAVRFPGRVDVLLLKYKYLKSTGESPGKLLQLAEEIISRNPGALEAYYHAIHEADRLGDRARMHEYLLGLIAADTKRRHLPFLLPYFSRDSSQ